VPGRQSLAPAPHGARVEGVEHWAHKGDVRLFLWEKFVDSPRDKPVLLFELWPRGMTAAGTSPAATTFARCCPFL